MNRWTEQEILILAAKGLGKVDTLGPRGATLCSTDEIEAMAGVLALLGLVPIPPGGPLPSRLILQPEKGL